jgi:CRISPR-associated endoribonuclease Cas6
MPVMIELRLHPERPIDPTTRQLHGLACALFESWGPGHEEQEKPFTVQPLHPVTRDKGPGDWLLRGAWLPGGFPQGMLTSLGTIRLGPVTCTVTDVAFQPVRHEDLAAEPSADGARVTLLSPAYFSQNGAYITEPDPRLIAGSWRRRWNASLPHGHPLRVDAGLWRDIHLALHVTGSGLRTEPRDTGYRQQDGLVGTMTLRLETGACPAARVAFGALARFAEYCGTGAQVTHGFGATKTTILQSSWSTPETSASASDREGTLR